MSRICGDGLRPRIAAETSLQGLGRLAFGELDQRHHLQGVDVIGPRREDFGVERLGLRQPALVMKLQGLRQQLRDIR